MLQGKLICSAGELDCTYSMMKSNHFTAKLVTPLLNTEEETTVFTHLVSEDGKKLQIIGIGGIIRTRNLETNNIELSELSGSVA